MKGRNGFFVRDCCWRCCRAAGCLSPHRSAVADVDPLGWREAAEVRFPNADTLAVCDLWLVVRYDAAFAGGRSIWK